MPKIAQTSELTLGARSAGVSLPYWLYKELRADILSGRLSRGSRVPATRELARQHGVSRGTVVTAFEQLITEGYLESRPGTGTFVAVRLPEAITRVPRPVAAPPAAPKPEAMARPFRFYEPALLAFPMDLWARIASRRYRRASERMLAAGETLGYGPLREAVADYLRRSRGVVCRAEQVAIVSGTNQSLDLAARLILQPGDTVWMEDPGYPGAMAAFRNSDVKVVPVRVDAQGLDPRQGQRLDASARAVYLTPAHQFPLAVTMPLERRLAILQWARQAKACVFEDDYDSEFRYGGKPVAAMQGLDPAGTVIFMGSFNKTLFPSLRLAYMVVPERLVDPLRALRASLDRFPPTLEQATLCDFLTEGHFGRHLRRMRELYGGRLEALRSAAARYLEGSVMLPDIHAGLHIPAYLTERADARVVADKAARRGLEITAIHRFLLRRKDVNALLLGFAAFEERAIRDGIRQLAAVLEGR